MACGQGKGIALVGGSDMAASRGMVGNTGGDIFKQGVGNPGEKIYTVFQQGVVEKAAIDNINCLPGSN